MNIRSLPSRFATLALVLALATGLGACRSSNETMDDDSNMDGGMMDQPAQVSTSGTIDVLEQGLTNISVDAAVENINGWEARLTEANASGFSNIIDDLGELEDELQSGSIDASNTAQLLNDLGRQTRDAASMASGRAADNVRTLGETLIAGSRALR